MCRKGINRKDGQTSFVRQSESIPHGEGHRSCIVIGLSLAGKVTKPLNTSGTTAVINV